MIFVTGGSNQGKLSYVQDTFHLDESAVTDGEFCAFEDAFTKPVLDHLHLLIKRMIMEEAEPEPLIEKGLAQNPGAIILCDEVGCGIVPISREARALREKVGRLQCTLASRADRVYRVSCGIAMPIKGA